MPDLRYMTLRIAADAAFRAGDDDLAQDIAECAINRFPEGIVPRLTLADLSSFRGEYAAALELADEAWLLNPTSAEAGRRVVRLSYLGRPSDTADQIAIDALDRFKHNAAILWAVCKNCTSETQFDAIHRTWRSRITNPKQIAAGVRQVAHAAIRVERFDVAIELYAEASLLELHGKGSGKELPEKTLAGRSGLSVIVDLHRTLHSAGIPYFLAAGTALGIVRNGRPIDHDKDIDVGIFEEDWDRDSLIEIFRKSSSFDVDTSHPKNSKVGLIHRGGANIDLFKFYREGNNIYHNGVFVRWKNTPFDIQEYALPSGQVYIPSNEDRYLTENYGDWKIPDSSFDAFVNGPNVEITWPDYYEAHRARRAWRSPAPPAPCRRRQ
jgi:tetratricopeptide (TPR) repeat protein